jgi:hypothetical protein
LNVERCVLRGKSYWPNIIGGGLAIFLVAGSLFGLYRWAVAVDAKIPFWSKPVVRDLVITNQVGGMVTVRQVLLVSYDGVTGDEIKPETENGRMTIWVYRQGQRFKEAPRECPGPDGRMTPVNGYLLFDTVSKRLVTFLLDGGATIPTTARSMPSDNT